MKIAKRSKLTRLAGFLMLCLTLQSCATSNTGLIDTAKAGSVYAKTGDVTAAKELVDAFKAGKANVNDLNRALIDAAEDGNTAAVSLLISAGADVNAQSSSGETALSLAIENGHTEIANILRNAGAR